MKEDNAIDKLVPMLQNPASRNKAMAELMRLTKHTLYWHIRKMVLVHEDADDVLQNTFVKAWQGIANFRGDSSLSTWLYRIASNESLDFISRQKRNGLSLDDDETKVAQAVASRLESDPYFDGEETELQLQQAIAQLPKKQRLVFTMKYYDEMKYEEMSSVLGTSVGALKASYHHAVQKISTFFGLLD